MLGGNARRWRAGALLALAVLPLQAIAESPAALEYKVKTGYLFNFANYVEWPAGTLPAPNSPFVIGVMDDGEALPILQSLLKGKRVRGHPVQVRAVGADRVTGLHILFVSRASGVSPEKIGEALGGASTLLVGETERFAENGGMVGFVREGETIRFQLNLERLTEAGLRASAKLASVARLVSNGRAP